MLTSRLRLDQERVHGCYAIRRQVKSSGSFAVQAVRVEYSMAHSTLRNTEYRNAGWSDLRGDLVLELGCAELAQDREVDAGR